MNFKGFVIMSFFAVVILGVFVLSGCCKKMISEPKPEAGPAEKTGAAIDKAIEKTGNAAKKFVDKANTDLKDVANKTVEKTGEILEKAGAAIEKKGEEIQDKNP